MSENEFMRSDMQCTYMLSSESHHTIIVLTVNKLKYKLYKTQTHGPKRYIAASELKAYIRQVRIVSWLRKLISFFDSLFERN